MPDFEKVNFANAYFIAAGVREKYVQYPGWPDDLDGTDFFNAADDDVLCRLAKPHRWSLLHHVIKVLYYRYYIVDFEHYRHDKPAYVVDEYSTILKLNGLPMPALDLPYNTFDDDYERRIHTAIETLRESLPLEAIANSAFQLLFGDRTFLLAFNGYFARKVQVLCAAEHPELLERDGMLRRVRLPAWAKQGIILSR